MAADDLERLTERVLGLVESIPAGRVMSYGAIAAAIGHCGPRQVARVMARDGAAVPWWRVVHADGSPYAPEQAEAAYVRERTQLRPGSKVIVDMSTAAWDPSGVIHPPR